MLSVSTDKYLAPIQWDLNDGTSQPIYGWKLWSLMGDESVDFFKPFNYTIKFQWKGYPLHFTFVYDGISVSPNKRTLRILGADCTSMIVSRLSSMREPMSYEDGRRLVIRAIANAYGVTNEEQAVEFARRFSNNPHS